MWEKKGDTIVLTVGSLYRITSLQSKEGSLETEGIFRGYTNIGSDEAICIELNERHGELKGKIRVIPTAMIASIDILKPIKEETKDEEKTSVYFG